MGLSDERALPKKWTFPNYILAPNDFIVLLANGKGRQTPADHYEAAVFPSDTGGKSGDRCERPSNGVYIIRVVQAGSVAQAQFVKI